MTELRPRGRELVDAARLERTPTLADRERVLEALLATSKPVEPASRWKDLSRRFGKRTMVAILALSLASAAYLAICWKRKAASGTLAGEAAANEGSSRRYRAAPGIHSSEKGSPSTRSLPRRSAE